jgi:hypothetical protein
MGYPHHIIYRVHNRQVVFASDEDYQYYSVLVERKAGLQGLLNRGKTVIDLA